MGEEGHVSCISSVNYVRIQQVVFDVVPQDWLGLVVWLRLNIADRLAKESSTQITNAGKYYSTSRRTPRQELGR